MWNTLILTWSKSCVISSATGKTEFSITDTKLSLRFLTLSTEGNIKLLKQLVSGLTGINRNLKKQTKNKIEF